MEKKKDELLNFAFNEQDEKLKFYRETLVEMTKGLIGYTPMHKLAEDAGKITEEIMKKVDEFEVAMEQHFALDEKRVNYYFGGDNCVAKDFTCTYPNFFKGVNPDFLKTEPMGTIVDNGPQYQTNQKPYGTLGEHWKELMDLFDVKAKKGKDWKRYFDKCIDYIFFDTDQFKFVDKKIKSVANILGIEFIIDFVKACEKCED